VSENPYARDNPALRDVWDEGYAAALAAIQSSMSPPGEKGWDMSLKHGLFGQELLAAILCDQKTEVKRDRAAWKTGNVFVEHSYNGNGSGIHTTVAPWWAFVIDDYAGQPQSIVMVPSLTLKTITRYWLKKRGPQPGGDGGRSTGTLVPLVSLPL